MSALVKPFTWFYHEFGVASITATGRNAWLIITARSCRMFAYGTNSLILGIFFSALGFSDQKLGLFMTLTLLGDVFLGTFLTLVADKLGRRKVLLGGSLLMMWSGFAFAIFENFWILLFAAIVGVISVTGGDFGPFRSIEESILSHLTTPQTRSDVLAWYVTTSTLGSSLGSEASGRIISALQDRPGWSSKDAYHALFWLYTGMGFTNAALTLMLTQACEVDSSPDDYAEVPQDDDRDIESPSHPRPELHVDSQPPPPLPLPSNSDTWLSRLKRWFGNSLTQISPSTRSVMYKLWFLLASDSLADGMVPYSLVNYYLDIKFHPSKSTLGDVTSINYFAGAVTAVFVGPLAHRIGLINTMVFTHVPSSAAVLFFPFPPYFWMAAALLFIRAGLNNMDQAPRSAFIAAVVKPEERTAVMGITAMLRTLAAMAGPTITGLLASGDRFWIAFVLAGICRLAYDFGLYAMFVNMKLYENEKNKDESQQNGHIPMRETGVELDEYSIAGSSESGEDLPSMVSPTQIPPADNLNILQSQKPRSRSPHQRTDSSTGT